MNFATLKGLTIPEGVVTQIADASGRVLWKQAPSGATVTLTTNAGFEHSITIGDQIYSGNTVLTVPIGTVVKISSDVSQVVLHKQGQYVGNIGYEYTVMGDIEIYFTGTKPVPTFTAYVIIIDEL